MTVDPGWLSTQEAAALRELSTAQLVVTTPDCLSPSDKARNFLWRAGRRVARRRLTLSTGRQWRSH